VQVPGAADVFSSILNDVPLLLTPEMQKLSAGLVATDFLVVYESAGLLV
jgi:hypothetical protein